MATKYRKSNEPFWWALFGAGGVLSAMFTPVLLVLLAIAIPLGWMEAPTHESLYSAIEHPIIRLVLLAMIALPLFHWAHRFRFTLYDGLQVKHLNELIAVICYGGALAGTVAAGYFLWTF